MLSPAVNQIRVSDDYAVDLTHKYTVPVNLFIGTSSLLAAALGLAPSKDVFWTSSSVEPESSNRYPTSTHEEHPFAEAVVAALSAGPVASGDGFGMENRTLLATLTAKRGRLLKPSFPAIPIEAYYRARAFGGQGPTGELLHAPSDVGGADGGRWVSVLGLGLKTVYSVNITTQLNISGDAFAVFPTPLPLSGTATVTTAKTVELQAGYISLSNVVALRSYPHFTLLGERGKIVPASPKRFLRIDGNAVKVQGCDGERISVIYGRLAGNNEFQQRNAMCTVEGGTCTISLS